MRRPLLVLVLALLALVGLTAPAGAGGSTDIVVGFPDGSFVVESVPNDALAVSLERARRRPGVAWAEIDRTYTVAGTVTPNDPLFPQQWGMQTIRAPEAWSRSTGATSVVVAVVDSGVDASHPDLAGAVLAGADFVDDGLSGDPAGHGTGVAGVIAGRGNNGRGMAGVCWACKILPVRVLDARGSGSASTIAAGITWAVDRGADIVNLSLAGERTSTALEYAIADARRRGAIVIAAAGNQLQGSTTPLTTPQYPAASDGVIGVVATNTADAVYPWSFRGTWTDVAAPGCVLSTAPSARYAEQCGTSFAAPAIAGLFGLAMGAHPDVPLATIERTLYSSATRIAAGATGHGRVDAARLLAQLDVEFPEPIEPQRVAGLNRVGTAVELSKRSHAAADTVVVARADDYVDALIAAPLAGRLGAPVLLTGRSALDPLVAAEIRRLGATRAWMIGGEELLGSAIEDGLAGAGVTDRRRVEGATAYARAASIASELGGTRVFVASLGGWPDAVSVSGLAAMTEQPILLVDRDRVPAETSAALTDLGATTVTVIGGTAVVGAEVQSALATGGRTVRRLHGATRYETSRAVADAAVAAGADPRSTWFATGVDWPDALAAGPAAATGPSVLLLVDGKGTTQPSVATSWLQGISGLRELVIVGGEAAVTTPVASMLAAAVPV